MVETESSIEFVTNPGIDNPIYNVSYFEIQVAFGDISESLKV